MWTLFCTELQFIHWTSLCEQQLQFINESLFLGPKVAYICLYQTNEDFGLFTDHSNVLLLDFS